MYCLREYVNARALVVIRIATYHFALNSVHLVYICLIPVVHRSTLNLTDLGFIRRSLQTD